VIDRVVDIGIRKQAEQEVLEAREKLHATLEQLPAAVVIAGVPSGRLLLANRLAATLFDRPFLLPLKHADLYTLHAAVTAYRRNGGSPAAPRVRPRLRRRSARGRPGLLTAPAAVRREASSAHPGLIVPIREGPAKDPGSPEARPSWLTVVIQGCFTFFAATPPGSARANCFCVCAASGPGFLASEDRALLCISASRARVPPVASYTGEARVFAVLTTGGSSCIR
jgi:hypothetical protein